MKLKILIFLLFSIFFQAQLPQSSLEEIEQWKQKENKPIVVLFSTDWCGICQIQKRNLRKLPKDFWDKVYFTTINPEKYHKDIQFLGKKYSFVSNGSKGLHSIAFEWAGKRVPAYPFWVFIDAENKMATYEGLIKIEELQLIF